MAHLGGGELRPLSAASSPASPEQLSSSSADEELSNMSSSADVEGGVAEGSRISGVGGQSITCTSSIIPFLYHNSTPVSSKNFLPFKNLTEKKILDTFFTQLRRDSTPLTQGEKNFPPPSPIRDVKEASENRQSFDQILPSKFPIDPSTIKVSFNT